MTRVAIAILWLVTVSTSAHAAYMKGTITLDDGRTATLTLRPFRVRGRNVVVKTALMKCSGDACFRPTGDLGYELPFVGGYSLLFFNAAFPFDQPNYYCATQALGLKRAGVCRIQSRVICHVEDTHLTPIIQVAATGMLDVHRTTPSCRRILRRGGQ